MRILEYKENRVRGSKDFPVEVYYVDEQHPRYVMPLHWHGEHEIIKVIDGCFQYEIGNKKGTALPGDILYVNSGELHAGIPESCIYCCIVYDISFLTKSNTASRKILTPLLNDDIIVSLCLPNADEMISRSIQNLLDILLGKVGGNELQIHGLLYLLLGSIIQNKYYSPKPDDVLTKKSLSQLKLALSFIENNYSNPLTLDMLASEVGMSPKYFCYFFKHLTHFSPIDYLNRHRIEVACYRLLSGNENITEVAYSCGFNDLSYFIRVFKKVVGITPKQYFLRYNR